MAVSLRASSSAAISSTTSLVVPVPTGVQAGDYLIAFIHSQASTATTDITSVGWSRIGPAFVSSSSSIRILGFFGKFATSSEPSSYTFTVPVTGNRAVGFMAAYTGVDPTTPVALASSGWTASGSGTSLSMPALTGSANLFTLEVWAANFASPNSYALGSYTGSLSLLNLATNPAGTENTAVSRSALRVWSGTPTADIATHTIATTGTFAQAAAGIICLTAATTSSSGGGSGGNSSSSGYPLMMSNGTNLVSVTMKLADGNGGFTTPGGLKVVKPGYASVAQMLSQPVFYCAHRGGSADFPEMSEYAYGQSALAGYPALEISLSRSSDGVWFGLHDGTLDRTSLGTSGSTLTAANMTWAQIQTYSILGSVAVDNPSQPNQPYMRLEDLIGLYYTSHVIFIDPKVAVNYTSELLNYMDSLPNSTDRFIAKYYGVSGGTTNTTGWCHDASARGYKTWGYFYQADAPNYATYAPRWDILGMDYTANQASWTSILSYGKPVMGHICPTPAAANTALAYGAAGLMMSGVVATTPPAII